MELKKEFINLPKDILYDIYESIVYKIKNYDNITRSKMIDEIIKEYSQENFLYYMCTERELKFLELIENKQISKEIIKNNEWEIDELCKKCIFSNITYEIYDEQKRNVKKALKYYNSHKEQKKSEDFIVIFMISVIKINVEMLSKALQSIIESMFKIDGEDFDRLLESPLFHFYCDISKKYLDSFNDYVEMINYRNNYDLLDDLFELRKQYGIAGCIKGDIRDNLDIFYYGFPLRNKKVKKMYDEVNQLANKNLLFSVINEARILNNYDFIDYFVQDENLKKTIKEALEYIPCAIMNGFTPNDYKKEKEKEYRLNNHFIQKKQTKACLTPKEADEFYKLYFALLEYTNNTYNINPSIKKIDKQCNVNPRELFLINDYLFKNSFIIDNFIENNPYKFSKEELKGIESFKKSITDEFFLIGFQEEYTELLSASTDKIFMIKGIRCNIDEIFPNRKFPIIINTTLLMYKNVIIYNSYFNEYTINYGNTLKEEIINRCKNAIRYYHL